MQIKLLDDIPNLSVDKLVKLYIKSREAKAKLKKAFDEKVSDLDEVMSSCENFLLLRASEQGVEGFKTEFGTTYIGETTKISISDESAFFKFVLDTGDLDFFERRVSSRHLAEYMEAQKKDYPPGLSIYKEKVMRIKKA